MEITFLGLSCLRLRGRETDVLVDPLPEGAVARSLKLAPDIVVATEGATDPALLRLTDGRPQRVCGPGEYELRGVRITGMAAGGGVTVMRIEVDDVRVVALGRLGTQLAEEIVDRLGHVDVLALPVGGGDALGASDAAKVVSAIEPAVVIPLRYRVDGVAGDHEPVERFTKEMGLAEGWSAQAKLSLTGASGAVDETRVVVLEPRLG